MSSVIIRPYQKIDRDDVRRICCDNADHGNPIENIFPQRDIMADLLTSYYTDYEPNMSWVAVVDAKVVGYINGTLDNRKYGLVMAWLIIPKVLAKAFMKRLFFEKEVWGSIVAMALNFKRLFLWRKESFHSHQGHLHLAVSHQWQGKHIGHKLVKHLMTYANIKAIDEMTASVHDSNKGACQFFEKQKFTVKDKYAMKMYRKGKIETYHSVLYAKKLS